MHPTARRALQALCYFLIAQRALEGVEGFEVPARTVAAIEEQLWHLQVCDDGPAPAIPSTYHSNGTAKCPPRDGTPGHAVAETQLTSIETAGLALLPYDSRM